MLTSGLAVICRVCLQNVKKSAVLCEQCSLICHQRCSPNAPPTCDLRSQLLLYAQYAERDPANSFSPYEILATHANQPMSPTSPTSQTSDDGYSRRTSMDSIQPSPGLHAGVHPPTAFKVPNPFKRSKSSLTIDQDNQSSAASASQGTRQVTRKHSVLRRNRAGEPAADRERPRSVSSSSTSPNSASMRSAATASGSVASSQQHRRQISSGADRSDRMSRMTSFSAVSAVSGAETERDEPPMVGQLPSGSKRRQRESGGCTVQ